MQCNFTYKDGSQCEESCRPSEYASESIKSRGIDPDTKSQYVRDFFPILEYDNLCNYHRRMMEGRIIPSQPQNIPQEVLNKIYSAIKARLAEINLKKCN